MKALLYVAASLVLGGAAQAGQVIEEDAKSPPAPPGAPPPQVPSPQPSPTQAAPPQAAPVTPQAPPAAPQQASSAPGTITGAILSGAVISGATISGATISGATISIPGGSISAGSLSGTTIAGASISGATVSGATISGSTISGGTIVGGTISEGAVSGGATISAGTISGGTISSGTISEGTIAGGTIAGSPAAAAAKSANRGAPETPPGQPGRQTEPAPAAPRKDRGNPAPAGRRPPIGRRPDQPTQRAAPAGEEDEEDAAARALQYLLIQRGALLLPIWGAEIVTGLTYGHTSQDTVATVPGSSDAAPATTIGVRRRSHQVTGALTFRLGLPWDFQIEASVPASRVWSDVDLAGAARNEATALGLGDPRFSLTWQMIRAGSVMPDLFIAATWKPQIGSSPFDAAAGQVGLGTGYSAIGGTLTAVKTSDPLVFLASATYTANLGVDTKQGRRNPGDMLGFGGGAILAVSPETSMSFLLDFHYKREDTLDGKAVLGTDETAAILQLGLGMVMSRHVLVNFTVGAGLTSDSPDFQFGISVPVRF